MTTFQTTTLIVLPQALRLVIPPIVGQVITSFKDTSLVAIVGVFELLNVAIVVYWLFTYTMSRSSLRLEKKLGVGKR
jgi:general L-amino acid transport system permease protein